MPKTVEYLAGKVEGLEDDIREMKEEMKTLRKQIEGNTKWILLATGATSGVVFLSKAAEWFIRHGGKI